MDAEDLGVSTSAGGEGQGAHAVRQVVLLGGKDKCALHSSLTSGSSSQPHKGSRQVPIWPHQDLLPGRPSGLLGEAAGRQVPGSHHHDPEDSQGLAAEAEVS